MGRSHAADAFEMEVTYDELTFELALMDRTVHRIGKVMGGVRAFGAIHDQ